ncbi:outer membrane lipoprotein-sorting protein [Gammaproteobacteria bacterium]|nr:outer membrane lipoprotein-sorting protein [Gammaproteobacteria bacterium]
MRALLFSFLLTPGLSIGDLPEQSIDTFEDWSGRELLDLVYERHQQYPYVYEEQSMILIDRYGHKNTRKLRRYSRAYESGTVNFLLLFDSPLDVRGVALLAQREQDGRSRQSFYLPAFGDTFIENTPGPEGKSEDNFLGTDYSISNLVGDTLDHHKHIRRDDTNINETDYFVVDVYDLNSQSEDKPERRHYIKKDNLYISRTDHFDKIGRLQKRQTNHDVAKVHGDMWRANMMMMDNLQKEHRTIIKINKRVFSSDYVPREIFSESWIIANQPPIESGDDS